MLSPEARSTRDAVTYYLARTKPATSEAAARYLAAGRLLHGWALTLAESLTLDLTPDDCRTLLDYATAAVAEVPDDDPCCPASAIDAIGNVAVAGLALIVAAQAEAP